jgi:flagellar biogenesis protein FliO
MKRGAFGATLLALAVIVLTPGKVSADDPAPTRDWLAQQGTAPHLTGRDDGPSPWRIGGMFVLVAGLAGAAVYAKRRQTKNSGMPDVPSVSVVGAARVGSKAQIVLASVAGRHLLLGVTETSVRKLAWVDAVSEGDRDSRNANRFSSLLDGILTKEASTDPQDDPDDIEDDEDFRMPEPAQTKPDRDSRPSPALELALRTRDEVDTASTRNRRTTVRQLTRPQVNPLASDIEGQARGLSRRKGKRS